MRSISRTSVPDRSIFSRSSCTLLYRSRSFSYISSSVKARPFLNISSSSSLLENSFRISSGFSAIMAPSLSIQVLDRYIHPHLAVGRRYRSNKGLETLIVADQVCACYNDRRAHPQLAPAVVDLRNRLADSHRSKLRNG